MLHHVMSCHVMSCYVVSVAVGNIWTAHTKIATALQYLFVFCLSTVLCEERETG